jgi:hypothetical protein
VGSSAGSFGVSATCSWTIRTVSSDSSLRRAFAPWLGLRLVLGTPRGFLLGLRLRVLVGLLRHVS